MSNITPITDGYYTIVNYDVIAVTDTECAVILGQIHYWLSVKEANGEEAYFHDGRYWIYNSLNKWQEVFPFYTVDMIKRKLNKMRKMGILITGNYNKLKLDRTIWYSIDYLKLNEIIELHKRKINKSICGKSANAFVENPPDNTIINNIDINIENNINGASAMPNAQVVFPSLDVRNTTLQNQIDYALKHNNVNDDYLKEEITKIVIYFFKQYRIMIGEEHPVLKQETMNHVVESLLEGTELVEEPCFDIYKELIDRYFDCEFEGCDYHITHFVAGHVRDYRWYECGMGGVLKD